MNHRDKTLAAEECRKLFVRDTLIWETAQHSRCHQDYSYSRVYQPLVDCSHHRHPETEVLFAKPYTNATGFQEIVQFLGRSLPVVPRVAEEHVSEIGLQDSQILYVFSNRC